jgi:signal transduction histidine kinase
MNTRQSLYLVFATVAAYALWEIVAHSSLMFLPMPVWHWISGGVGTILALAITALATRAILKQERRLEELARLKDDLMQMVVHDLRTPLMAIIGSLDTMKVGAVGHVSGEAREMVDMAMEGSHRLMNMVDDLLDISRLEEGKSILEITETEVQPIVAEAVNTVEPIAKARGTVLAVDAQPDIPMVRLDREKMHRVMVNLLSNALKFTPSGGWIDMRVTWDKPLRRLAIAISDNGPGIPLEYRKKIFDKFFRVQAREGNRLPSAGLGLAFCKMIAEAHHGAIRVESEAGKGSTFTVEIPG